MPSVIAGAKSRKYGKIGIAKANTVRIISEGAYETERQRFLSLSTSLGITYAPDNTVNGNLTNDRISSLEQEDVSIDGRLDTLEAFELATAEELSVINNKLEALATLLGITFNPDGTLSSETYTAHTHSYEDDNGTNVTTKTTQGVD